MMILFEKMVIQDIKPNFETYNYMILKSSHKWTVSFLE